MVCNLDGCNFLWHAHFRGNCVCTGFSVSCGSPTHAPGPWLFCVCFMEALGKVPRPEFM